MRKIYKEARRICCLSINTPAKIIMIYDACEFV